MKKSYCANCKKEVSEDMKKCDCGSRVFIFGDIKMDEENHATCACGSQTFKQTMHLDYTDKAVTYYQCTECGCVNGKECYRNKEDRMYWE